MKKATLNYWLTIVIFVSLGLALVPAASAADWGVDTATAPSANWLSLSAGENHWYGFHYAGDSSEIQVRLEAVPEGSVAFAVWTPEQIWRWGRGEYVEPVGRGSEDPRADGAMVWSGSFPISGTYYVVVEPGDSPQESSFYRLAVDGAGVTVGDLSSAATPTYGATPAKARSESETTSEPTGKLVFQTTFGGTFYTIQVDGTELRPITHGRDPVWSPDGQQIAFVRWEDPRGIWVVNPDGSDEGRVFDWPRETRYPSWSPDGEQIVFSRQHRGRIDETERCMMRGSKLLCFTLPPNPHYNLGVVEVVDGSFWEPLPSSSERSLTPDWSPDGDEIVYQDVYGLFVQSADGQTRYQLTDNNRDTSPVWSPNGSQVAFVRRQHDHWEVYVVDADGSHLTRLTDTPALPDGTMGNSVSPAWSPDGNWIAFLTDRTGAWDIWIMEADGSNQRPMFDNELDGLTLEYSFNGERAIDWSR